MNFYSNLTILYQTSPHVGGKLTSCVAVLTQNTCMCGCRPVLYYFKVSMCLLKRFIESWMVIMDQCVLQSHHFLPRKYQFRRKWDKFYYCSGPKHMYVCLQTGTIPFELQYYFIIKVHEAWDGNHRLISSPTLPFSLKPVPTLGEN